MSISCIFVSSFHIQCNFCRPFLSYCSSITPLFMFAPVAYIHESLTALSFRRPKHRPNRHPRKPNQQHSYLSQASGEHRSSSSVRHIGLMTTMQHPTAFHRSHRLLLSNDCLAFPSPQFFLDFYSIILANSLL